MLILFEKLLKWVFIASLFGLLAGYWYRDVLPEPDHYDDGRALAKDPLQAPTRKQPFSVQASDQRYGVKPLFDYELRGVVVSMHHTDAWWDIYHAEWGDFINIKDICVIWGDNVKSGVYRDMEFENNSWTCWAYWPGRGVGKRFKEDQLSNNHLLADRPQVQRAIYAARPGDQVRVRGMLVEYTNPAKNFRRGTSISRKDRGNGACETIYVEDFQILRRANVGWRRLFNVSKWSLPLSGIGFVILLAVNPVRRRWRH